VVVTDVELLLLEEAVEDEVDDVDEDEDAEEDEVDDVNDDGDVLLLLDDD
jgi:hypothetical protein